MGAQRARAIGHQFAITMQERGPQGLSALANATGEQLSLDVFLKIQNEPHPGEAYLHSALCSMSLPTKRPVDEFAPIIREDGRYALAINPRPVLQIIDGRPQMKSMGVPYGSYPRIALIYMMTQAVQKQSRAVYLGENFTSWMRALGYNAISYGKNGTATRMREQVTRLLACEWQIRWDGCDAGENAFAVRDVKIANEYGGAWDDQGEFAKEIRLSEVFYSHLIEHAVPLNETAIRELKHLPTALDLYCYLSHRLRRVTNPRGQIMSWDQLSRHLGSTSDTRRFRQTVRDAMQMVSLVYPNANVDFSGPKVILYPSPAPLERGLIGPHLSVIPGGKKSPAPPSGRRLKQVNRAELEEKLALFHASQSEAAPSPKKAGAEVTAPAAEAADAAVELIAFPQGSLRYGPAAQPFYQLGLERGRPWDVDMMAGEFRRGFKGIDKKRSMDEWLRIFGAFLDSFVSKRKTNS